MVIMKKFTFDVGAYRQDGTLVNSQSNFLGNYCTYPDKVVQALFKEFRDNPKKYVPETNEENLYYSGRLIMTLGNGVGVSLTPSIISSRGYLK